jgi:hypothetical protein
MNQLIIAVFAAAAVAIVVLVAWGLLGPARRSDQSGPHVDLAEHNRKKAAERDNDESS